MAKVDPRIRRPIPSEAMHLLAYDSDTGDITWKESRHPVTKGSEAGAIRPDGYRWIGVNGKQYAAHRVAWFLHHGKQPPYMLDHENGNRDDNRIENIREITHSKNQRNRMVNSNSTTGVKGVQQEHSSGRFIARFKVNSKLIYVGRYDTIPEAEKAIRAKREELHGEFAHHG